MTQAPGPDTPLLKNFPPLARNRNFILLWLGYIVSALGDRIHAVAMLELLQTVKQHKVGTPENSQITIMMLLPFLFFGPFTGILADRLSRRGIMIVSDLARVVLVIVVRVLFFAVQSQLSIGQAIALLFASEFVLATFATAFSPARTSLLPTLVHPDQLLRANSMTNAAGTVASLMGIVIGGKLVGWDPSLHVVLFIDAAVFATSATLIFLMAGTKRASSPAKNTSVVREFRDGVAYIRDHKRVLQVIGLMFLFWCCGAIILNGLTGIIIIQFGLTIEWYSYFMGLVGVGMVLGAASVSLARAGIPKEIGIAWAMIAVGFFLMLFSLQNHWLVALLLLMAGAFAGAVLLVSLETLLQRIVPNFVRGRVMAAKDVINNAGVIAVCVPLALYDKIDNVIRLVLLCVSIVVGCIGLILLRYYYRRQNLPLPVAIMRRFAYAVMSTWHRFQRVSACTIPTTGPVIVVANHTSAMDPVALQISSPRRVIHFMMAKEYYEKWPWVKLYKAFGVIPVNRTGTDIASVRTALRTLSDGKVIGMFPEGGISVDGHLMEGKNGVAVLALRSGATVVPAYIDGTNLHVGMMKDFATRARVRIAYGRPLTFGQFAGKEKDKAVQDQVTAQIMTEIRRIRARIAPERARIETAAGEKSLGTVNAS